jgi:putative hemolysin
MEDLLERIFGDIPSPSDEEFKFQDLGENRYLVDGNIPLAEIDQRMGFRFTGGEMETLAGFVLHEFGELPSEGASIEIDDFRFTVKKVTRNRIADLLIESLQADPFVSTPQSGTGSEPEPEPEEPPPGKPEEVKKGGTD